MTMIEVNVKNEIKSFIVKKEGPLFLFAYDENGNQYGFAKTLPELIKNIENRYDEYYEWNSLSIEERRRRNAYTAAKIHGCFN